MICINTQCFALNPLQLYKSQIYLAHQQKFSDQRPPRQQIQSNTLNSDVRWDSETYSVTVFHVWLCMVMEAHYTLEFSDH
jgi:hypothetical protein